MPYERIAFMSSGSEEADAARDQLAAEYGQAEFAEADCIIALGGDGFMLEILHTLMDRDVPVYGMNLGTVGFLMNDFGTADLFQRLQRSKPTTIRPLVMEATDIEGKAHSALAINEVSLFRASFQAAKIEVIVDDKTRLEELICDGILLATPTGSTAYNLSAHGPILPLAAPMLAMTPISPFRPRRWRGAILPDHAKVSFIAHETKKRPVHAVADNIQFENVTRVDIHQSTRHKATLLYDPGHGLEERVLNEQFRF